MEHTRGFVVLANDLCVKMKLYSLSMYGDGCVVHPVHELFNNNFSVQGEINNNTF